jgi:hypothetical protein
MLLDLEQRLWDTAVLERSGAIDEDETSQGAGIARRIVS